MLKGNCVIEINDKKYNFDEGSAMICEPHDIHRVENRSEKEIEILVFKINKPQSSDDTEWIEE